MSGLPTGRVLGPKADASPAGTVTPDVVTAVQEFSAGKVEYRNDDASVACIIGKLSFSDEDLVENLEFFLKMMESPSRCIEGRVLVAWSSVPP